MLIIRKKEKTIRICMGYIKFNEIKVTDAEPIPRADKFITVMSSASISSKFDKMKAYYPY